VVKRSKDRVSQTEGEKGLRFTLHPAITHPDYATLVGPLFAFGDKEDEKCFFSTLYPPQAKRGWSSAAKTG
jgi:hypothetical protein